MADQKPAETQKQSDTPRKFFLTKDEYEAKYGDIKRRQDRERNIKLLLKLRPGVFTQEEQDEYADCC